MNYKKNNILTYINISNIETVPLAERLFSINNLPNLKNGEIIYLMTREFRFYDNFAIIYGLNLAKELNLFFRVLYIFPKIKTKFKKKFFNRNFQKLKETFFEKNISFSEFDSFNNFNISILIIDFNPLEKTKYEKYPFNVIEVDGHNIVPARFASNKQEYNAMTFRRKIYNNVGYFLNDFIKTKYSNSEAFNILNNFILNKLDFYSDLRNDPNKNITSELSPYINFGFISSQRIALEIIKSNAAKENKEAFLDELIIRKELAENFCLYCKNFKNLNCIPNWAKLTIKEHKNDLRDKIYSLPEFENAKTNDNLWNACQIQLLKEGRISSYLRMYWAKMILKWSISNTEAIKKAIYLNDKYAYDAPSTNGYASILWAIAGLHDRPFKDNYIFGKIRTMTCNGAKNKFNINEYISKYKA